MAQSPRTGPAGSKQGAAEIIESLIQNFLTNRPAEHRTIPYLKPRTQSALLRHLLIPNNSGVTGTQMFIAHLYGTKLSTRQAPVDTPLRFLPELCPVLDELLDLLFGTIFPEIEPFERVFGSTVPVQGKDGKFTVSCQLLGHRFISICKLFVIEYNPNGSLRKRQSTAIGERLSAGLLREDQIRLVEITMRALLTEWTTLVECYFEVRKSKTTFTALEDRAASQVLLSQALSASIGTAVLLGRFFCSKNFRSERLEKLLLRHIAEDGVNWEVVSRLKEAQIDDSKRII